MPSDGSDNKSRTSKLIRLIRVRTNARDGSWDTVNGTLSPQVLTQLRYATRFLVVSIVFLVAAVLWWSAPAFAQTTGGPAVAADPTSNAPLLAVTGGLASMTAAVGLVIRAFIKGDIVPKSAAAREDKLIEANASLTRLLEEAQRREDQASRREEVFWDSIGGLQPRPHHRAGGET